VSVCLAGKRRGKSHFWTILLVDPTGICRFCNAKQSSLPTSIWTKHPPKECNVTSGSTDQKGPARFRWADATMAPSYSYIAEREDLHLIPLAILRTPPQRAWIESIIDDNLLSYKEPVPIAFMISLHAMLWRSVIIPEIIWC